MKQCLWDQITQRHLQKSRFTEPWTVKSCSYSFELIGRTHVLRKKVNLKALLQLDFSLKNYLTNKISLLK